MQQLNFVQFLCFLLFFELRGQVIGWPARIDDRVNLLQEHCVLPRFEQFVALVQLRALQQRLRQ